MNKDDLLIRGGIATKNGTIRVWMTTYVEQVCEFCEKPCWVRQASFLKAGKGFCDRTCAMRYLALSKEGNKRANTNGYILVRLPYHPMADKHGEVLEHRLVMAEKIGRMLTAEELVHHKDENRSNNDPENLELIQPTEEESAHIIHRHVHREEGELHQLKLQGLRRCSTCREIKALEGFAISLSNPHGYNNVCRACCAASHKRRNPNALTRAEGLQQAWDRKWAADENSTLAESGQRKCKTCEAVKVLEDFNPNKGVRGGREFECKTCKNEKKAAWARAKRAARA